MPIDPSIPLQAQGSPDNSGKLMQFAQLQQMGQQRQQQAAQLREAKRVKEMASRGAGLFMRYQSLKDQGFSEQAAHAAMQEDYQREIGGLASVRDDNGAPLFDQSELGQMGQEFNAGKLGSILPKLMGADKAMDLYFKDRELKAKGSEPTSDMKEYAAAQKQGFKGTLQEWIVSNKKAGATMVNVNTGNMPLTKPAMNETQKDVISADVQLGNLRQIKKDYQESFLTYGGKLKNFADRTMAKVDPNSLTKEDRALLGKQTQFKQQVNRVFNAYRKEITGAAAALAELEQLKQAMIDVSQSPPEFEAAYESYERELLRTRRLKRKLLREGLKVTDEREFGSAFDQAFTSGADDDPIARGEELEAAGTSDDKIVETLQAEGYIE